MNQNWLNILLFSSLILIFTAGKATAQTHAQTVDARTKPVGEVVVSGAPVGGAAAPAMLSGKERYAASCGFCHDSGAAGAPNISSKSAWAPRLAKGVDVLVKNAINGIGAMPAKGMCPSCSDEEIKAAVEYMVSQVK